MKKHIIGYCLTALISGYVGYLIGILTFLAGHPNIR